MKRMARKSNPDVGDGPKTVELGDDSPGYISLYTGRQIVRAYMDKNPDTSSQRLTIPGCQDNPQTGQNINPGKN